MSSDWSAVELMSRLLVHSIYINSYYEEEQSILNYIMSYGEEIVMGEAVMEEDDSLTLEALNP